ncbi:MAG: O-antigen ligase family protein [Hyphomonas sp.]
MRFAPVLAGLFVLWPVMAALGAQGFAPMVLLMGVAALVLSRPKWPPAPYFIVFICFVGWVVATEWWSPRSQELISGSLQGGDFAIRAVSLRIGLAALFCTLAIAGALRIPDKSANKSARIILCAFAVHGLMLVAIAIPEVRETVLQWAYRDDLADISSGQQNIGRAANAFALCLPLLVSYLFVRHGWFGKATTLIIVVSAVAAFQLLDASSAVIGALMMIFCMVVVWLARQSGFRILLSLIGSYIAATPVIYGIGIATLRDGDVDLPASFQSRVWAWDLVIQKTIERPFMGNGLGASKTWNETYRAFPEWMAQVPAHWADYRIIPGHPHNMALQIWAETGVVGSVLSGLACVALAFSLPRPKDMRADIRYATAGLIGVTITMFSFAYSVWNEAFWASVAMIVVATIIVARRDRQSI